MSSRKFRDILEPLRARRLWGHDRALREVANLRSELESMRTKETQFASSLAQQSLAGQDGWKGKPNPETHLATISWLAEQHALRMAAEREVSACERRLVAAIAAWDRAHAALDAVDKKVEQNRSAHSRAAETASQTEADANWLTRKGRT
jgi:hypothetical protein